MHTHYKSPSFKPSILAIIIATTLISTSAMSQEEKAKPGIEVIEVTAQKRVESIQEVPISISAFSTESLRKIGISNIDDLGNIAPGFEANNVTKTQPVFDIRGIRTNDFFIGSDPAVGIYIDDVYVGRSGSALLSFNDVERVEVLKGPQGTLFGRNTAAGAVRIISNKPVDDTEGSYRVTLGNYDKKKFEGVYNFPLSDNLFFRGSMAWDQRDGYVDAKRYVNPREATSDNFKNVKLGTEEGKALKASVLWKKSDKTDMLFKLEYDGINNDGRPNYSVNPDFYRSASGSLNPYGSYETDIDAYEKRDLFGSSVEVTHEFDIGTFTSITAYRRFHTKLYTEDDGSAFSRGYFASINIEEQEQFSQEFRLAGQTDFGTRWTVGATYSNEDIYQSSVAEFMMDSLDSFAINQGLQAVGVPATGIPALGIPGIADIPVGSGLTGFLTSLIPEDLAFLEALSGTPADRIAQMITADNLGKPWTEVTDNFGDYTSYAAFFDVTYPVTQKLDVTLGVRYTHDQKDFGILSFYQNEITIPIPGVPSVPFGLAFSTEYVLRDAQGNPVLKSQGQHQPFQQDESWSKVTPRLVVDYQWNDNVMTYLSAASGFKSGGFNSLGAAPPFAQEEVDNLEFGLKSTLLDNRLKLNVSAFDYDYSDLQILRLTGSTGSVPVYNVRNVDAAGKGIEIESQWAITDNLSIDFNYAYLDTEYTKYSLFAGETAADDLTGRSLSGVPENRFFVGVDYFIAADSGEWSLHMDLTSVDERANSDSDLPLSLMPVSPATIKGLTADNKIDSYKLLNARIAYKSDNDWELALFARNLADEEYLLSNIGGQGANTGSANLSRGLPRMWGIEFSQSF